MKAIVVLALVAGKFKFKKIYPLNFECNISGMELTA